MENYVKVFELFDKRTNVFKNASVDKIEGQSKQPYTQTINYFFTFEEAKKKISSIWNFSTPELNKRIDKEISPSLIKKFGDKVKDKLGISKEKEIKIKSLTSLDISEKKESNQLFYYTYKGLRIAKIEFDRTKVHNRSWKLIFYYYDGVNGDASKKVSGEIPSDNKKKEDNIPGNIESNKQGEEKNNPKELGYNKPKELGYKKDIVIPFIDSSKKALDFIKKHLDYIYRPSDTEIEIGDMKVLKDSNKKFIIKTDNRSIEVKDPTILKGLNQVFNYEGSSDAKQIGNGETPNEEPKKTDKEPKKDTEEKVNTFKEYTNKNTPEEKYILNKLSEIKNEVEKIKNDEEIKNKDNSISKKIYRSLQNLIASDKIEANEDLKNLSKESKDFLESKTRRLNDIYSNGIPLDILKDKKNNAVEIQKIYNSILTYGVADNGLIKLDDKFNKEKKELLLIELDSIINKIKNK